MSASNPPFVLHQPKHEHAKKIEKEHPHAARIPAIPDLRFEQTYMKSIQPYVHITRPEPVSGHDELESEYETISEKVKQSETTPIASGQPAEIVQVQWGRVAYVTLRDQVLSPLVQGAAWALISGYFGPIAKSVLQSFRHSSTPKPEGSGAAWLRGWIGGLGLGSQSPATTRHNATNYDYKY